MYVDAVTTKVEVIRINYWDRYFKQSHITLTSYNALANSQHVIFF